MERIIDSRGKSVAVAVLEGVAASYALLAEHVCLP